MALVDLLVAEPSAMASLRLVLVVVCSQALVSVKPRVLLLVASIWALASATVQESALPQQLGDPSLLQTVREVSPPHQEQNLHLHRLHQDH